MSSKGSKIYDLSETDKPETIINYINWVYSSQSLAMMSRIMRLSRPNKPKESELKMQHKYTEPMRYHRICSDNVFMKVARFIRFLAGDKFEVPLEDEDVVFNDYDFPVYDDRPRISQLIGELLVGEREYKTQELVRRMEDANELVRCIYNIARIKHSEGIIERSDVAGWVSDRVKEIKKSTESFTSTSDYDAMRFLCRGISIDENPTVSLECLEKSYGLLKYAMNPLCKNLVHERGMF